MLSKCANPDCSNTLHYLREGKVFKIDSDDKVTTIGGKPVRRVEHFWLCGPCSQALTLTYDKLAGVQVTSKPSLARRAIA